MRHHKVLIIDDDQKLADALVSYLRKFDYETQHCDHPKHALAAITEFEPDLIILDIMMPEVDGLTLCKEIRHTSSVPIIFLSARGDTMDRIVGLELGADDYLPKPFEPRELVARMESVLRRGQGENNKANGPLRIDENSMQAVLHGKKLELTATEFQALSFLFKNRERIVSRDELLNFLQGIDSEVFSRAIDILISRVRQKLADDPKTPKFIKTIRGHGYRYIGESQ